MASRDRLAQHRAQQQQQPQQPYAQGNGASYGQPAGNAYEMTSTSQYANGGAGEDLTAFYAEIDAIHNEIRRYNENVTSIQDLYTRSLDTLDQSQTEALQSQLDRLSDSQRQIAGGIKTRIKVLSKTSANNDAKKQQVQRAKDKFNEAIQNYQLVEQQNRKKYEQRVERQFRLVKPNATAEEVKAVVENRGGGQIFTDALMDTTRYDESRAAYRDVQSRHADILKIERTLVELQQLMNEMALIIDRDDEKVDNIRENARKADADVEAGLKHTEQAVISAWAARNKKWILFWIVLVIIVVIVLAVVLKLQPWNTNK